MEPISEQDELDTADSAPEKESGIANEDLPNNNETQIAKGEVDPSNLSTAGSTAKAGDQEAVVCPDCLMSSGV